MPSKLKTQNLVSQGHNCTGKHQKHPGVQDNAGSMHEHRINVYKYHPLYFGKVGISCDNNCQE
uniref:Uncharacterized protein n=1 Tax=Bos indicus x Bos taurus TaxID=30522 RepID=A0A4W2I934_BOBOX